MPYNITRAGSEFTGAIPVKGGENIETGGIYGVDANGHMVADPTTATSIQGRAEIPADNTEGINGDVSIPLRRGTYEMVNSEVAPVTDAHLGADLFIEDPQTVASAQAAAEPIAGKCRGLTPDGYVRVEIL